MRSTYRILFYTKNQAVKNGKAPIMDRITALSIRSLIASRPRLTSTISIFATMTVLSRLRKSIIVTSVLVKTATHL